MFQNILSILPFALLFASCARAPVPPIELSEHLALKKPSEKIWAHRFNSINTAEERMAEFSGIEIDIYYISESDRYEVKHDADSTGIELESFLDSILALKEVDVWFDHKNLKQNTHAGIDLLTRIIDEKNLTDRCFVESSHAKELGLFDERIATSYWISYADIPESESARKKLFEERFEHLNEYDFEMLSTSYEMFHFMQEFFPDRMCNYWMSGELDSEHLELLEKMANEPNVNIILVDGNRNFLK